MIIIHVSKHQVEQVTWIIPLELKYKRNEQKGKHVYFFTAGIGVRYFYLYYKSGHDAILPCDNAAPLDSSCSVVHWLYSKDRSGTAAIVYNGAIEKNSSQAARLSLHSKCHLGIQNITAEDAGGYCCRPGKNTDQDTVVYLHILNSGYLHSAVKHTTCICVFFFLLIP